MHQSDTPKITKINALQLKYVNQFTFSITTASLIIS